MGVDFAWRSDVAAVLILGGAQDELHERAKGRAVVEIHQCLIDAATVPVFDVDDFAVVCRYYPEIKAHLMASFNPWMHCIPVQRVPDKSYH